MNPNKLFEYLVFLLSASIKVLVEVKQTKVPIMEMIGPKYE
jgi:hypothetical protein